MKHSIAIMTALLALTMSNARADTASFERETGLRDSYLKCYQRADLACVRNEILEQSQRLSAVLQRWRDTARSHQEREARDAENANWRANRDAHCAWMAQSEGGDNPELAHADCQASTTASRVLALQAKLEASADSAEPRPIQSVRGWRL